MQICKISCKELTEKCGYSVQCDLCDEHICPKFYDKRDNSVDDDFFVVRA